MPLNCNPDLDFLHVFNNSLDNNADFDNPYLTIQIDGKFHETSSILQIQNILDCPVYISLNVQSLNSKFESLCHFIKDLLVQNVKIEIIAIQECWKIEFPELLVIPGYHPFIFKQREGMRGEE